MQWNRQRLLRRRNQIGFPAQAAYVGQPVDEILVKLNCVISHPFSATPNDRAAVLRTTSCRRSICRRKRNWLETQRWLSFRQPLCPRSIHEDLYFRARSRRRLVRSTIWRRENCSIETHPLPCKWEHSTLPIWRTIWKPDRHRLLPIKRIHSAKNLDPSPCCPPIH